MTLTADTLRVVVADDEPIARRGLLRLLRNIPEVVVVGEAGDGERALQLIRQFKPSVVFLDVQMPGGSGIEVANALASSERPAIVFVTAFDKFAIHAFEVHAVDYLLKPFDEQRLLLALDRVRQRLGTALAQPVAAETLGALNERLDALLVTLGAARDHDPASPAGESSAGVQSSVPENTLVVRDGERVILVPLDELDWCEAADNYVRLHTKGRKHLIRETMRNIEERLVATRSVHARFARIHRSMIVNLIRVREIKPAGGGEYVVVLADGTKLALSRGYRDRVMEALGV